MVHSPRELDPPSPGSMVMPTPHIRRRPPPSIQQDSPRIPIAPATVAAAGMIGAEGSALLPSPIDKTESLSNTGADPGVTPAVRLWVRKVERLVATLGVSEDDLVARLDLDQLLQRVEHQSARLRRESPAERYEKAGGAKQGSKKGVWAIFGRKNDVGPRSAEGMFCLLIYVECAGPAIGVGLEAIPDNAWCTSLIGGQRHQLPIVVFAVVEEIYRRGEEVYQNRIDHEACPCQGYFGSRATALALVY